VVLVSAFISSPHLSRQRRQPEATINDAMSKIEKVKTATSAAFHGRNPKDAVAALPSSRMKTKQGNGGVALPPMSIPEGGFQLSSSLKTPKTPADEGIDFFESAVVGDQPIQVYELKLDADGGPNKDRSVSGLWHMSRLKRSKYLVAHDTPIMPLVLLPSTFVSHLRTSPTYFE